ncbi:MAG: dimethylsulfonioproprionate lyase DddP [Tabrizicola sp.]|uniref:dimethylsulfonioproprionate lyase DddP n=1 Tax=Tabrizicola sp. TaxID=2005166 RepID=UPI00273302CC|nr:dimethylsulfonioproprionate lyase DddP [Tabrizicola sp.]MDP3264989.1 Xaa-Pro peptidase family protein [Tabrizicola sp.]MDP3647468.1 Xaa-Pro peptidase family protein [Paracoccaceae bacterium]MDZ4066607.1 dimethylsulfonioproprionate lyase DddP [Tabrizicola sp.]
MNQHYADTRKIDPTRGQTLADGTPNDNNRVEIGPTQLAFAEWAAAGLTPPNLDAMRDYRWRRLTEALQKQDIGGLLMFDPLNIRYATDTTNMQLWNSHNPFRACLLCADGHMVMWEYKNSPFLVTFNPRVAELRSGASFFYNVSGDHTKLHADGFAQQVTEVMRAHAGTNCRLAVDKIMVHGLRALEAAGFEVLEGEIITERTRAVKGPDDILAMRCAHHACERAISEMETFTRDTVPKGRTSEDDIWAELHKGNIRRGGEWIETRLLASGPRTNPWFQECGPRIVQPNEIVAFDTDLIGAYGICIDISRTWWIGDQRPTNAMISAMHHAHDHIAENMAMLKPGVRIRDLIHGGHQLDAQYWRQKYSCKMHGVGLCDEWPFVPYPDAGLDAAFDVELQPGMVLCVEALVSPEGGDFSIKLEDQVLVTETGHENLTTYPFDPRLMG